MSNQSNFELEEQKGRAAGGTEYSWCRAVSSGTGITVVAFLSTKPPDVAVLRDSLREIQNSHAIFRSIIRFDATTKTFSFSISPTPYAEVQSFDPDSTSSLIIGRPARNPFHAIVEHELRRDTWHNQKSPEPLGDALVLLSSVYALPDSKWATTLRFHTAACDRTAGVAVLRELLELLRGRSIPGGSSGIGPAVEGAIPRGEGEKPLWARGLDLVGYSLTSLRITHLPFDDANSPRLSAIARMRLDANSTGLILSGCEARNIKLCGAVTAAGLIAAHSLRRQKKHYSVATLVDCRPMLEPPLSGHDLGFYQAAIVNVHAVRCGEGLWDLAERCFGAFRDAKKRNKHFSDMADLNFLLCKAIENPRLTPASSLRTSFMSIFEDTLTDDCSDSYQDLGVEDYLGCSSVHGIGPSIAVFDTIRSGALECTCVYPTPLHSSQRMEGLVQDMKRVLLEAAEHVHP